MNKQEFIEEVGKVKPGSTFMSLSSYQNAYGEISDYKIVFHMSYERTLMRSISVLESTAAVTELQAQAKQEMLDSYNDSIRKIRQGDFEKKDPVYCRFFDDSGDVIKGLKMHSRTGNLHLYGLIVSKNVLVPGYYPDRNKLALTIAKEKLRRYCAISKFRQFRILPEQVQKIRVQGIELLAPEEKF